MINISNLPIPQMKAAVLASNQDAQNRANARKCVCCEGDITEFRDQLSVKEYGISGLCQKCQDDVFGED